MRIYNCVVLVLDALNSDENQGRYSAFVKRGLFGGNLGLGVDLGFTYHLNEHTAVTGSVLDLGFIYHRWQCDKYAFKRKCYC